MPAQANVPEFARPYLEELHEFLLSYGIQHGSIDAVLYVVDVLEDHSTFAEDFASLVRSILLRRGGAIPRAELLEIVVVGIGGNNLDPSAPELQRACRELLSFVSSVAGRPWNEPPGQRDPYPPLVNAPVPVLEFPAPKTSPAFVRPESIYGRYDLYHPDADMDPDYDADVVPEPLPDLPPGFQPHPIPVPLPPPPLDLKPMVDLPAASVAASAVPIPTGRISPTMASFALTSTSMMGALMVGGYALALAVLLIVYTHSHSAATMGSVTGAAPVAHAAIPNPVASAAARPIPESQPTAAIAPAAPQQRPARSGRYDDYIAPPYSTPIPGEGPSPSPSVAAAPAEPVAPAVTHSAAGPSARPAGTSTRSIDPDSTYVGEYAWNRPAVAARLVSGRGFPNISSGIMASNLISATQPNYPTLARLTHTEGQVILQAVIDHDGSVSATHVLSGHRLLRGAAVDAVRQWRYRPYMMEGRPVDVATIVTVDFNNAH